MKKSPLFVAALLGTVLSAGPTTAQTPLRDVTEITEGLIAVGIAYEISEVCPSINARLFRGIGTLNALKSRARQLGYSNAEIDAFTDSKPEQDRLKSVARARMAGMGAVTGQPETFCALGQAQMQAGSAIGRLLR